MPYYDIILIAAELHPDIWLDTGIDVHEGDQLDITAIGSVSTNGTSFFGPDGDASSTSPSTIHPNQPYGRLIGKVQNAAGHTPISIGSSYSSLVTHDGRLFLAVNDLPSALENNIGGFVISIDLIINLTWTHVFDFANGQQGWIPGTFPYANWTGTHWESIALAFGSGYMSCHIGLTLPTLPADTLITSIAREGVLGGQRTDGQPCFDVYVDGVRTAGPNKTTTGAYTFDESVIRFPNGIQPTAISQLTTVSNTNYPSGTKNTITKVRFTGTGLNPFLDAPNHDGANPACPICHFVNGILEILYPINLRNGEKYEETTDLSLNTVAGTLAFTRAYRQSKLDSYQIMGLGWWHNHAAKIDTSVTNKLLVWLEHGTQAHFTQVGSTDIYQGDPGSTAQIDASGTGASKYTLTAVDDSTYVFDEDGLLRSRSWANGEEWSYDYYESPHFAEGLLKEVTDGYERKLLFAYIDNSGEYHHKQLWRVGDQTVTDLETSTPDGRYVEFGYLETRLDGSLTSPIEPLLHTVKDVRGNTWTYTYYGQESSEADSDQANFLIRYTSPSVDVDGDGIPDGSIILKDVTYTVSGSMVEAITQELGKFGSADYLKTIEYMFQPSGENITTETSGGKTTTHHFEGGVYLGPENANGDSKVQALDANYRVVGQQDANGNVTQLAWSSDGKELESLRDTLGNETGFEYDTEHRLISNTDATGRVTEYTYGDSNVPRQPTRIKMLKDSEVLGWQEFTFDTKGRTLTETLLDPSDGTTILQQITRTYYTSGNGNGLLHTIAQEDIGGTNDVSTIYTYDTAGRVKKTQKTSHFGSCEISFTLYDAAGNIVASICNYDPGMSAEPTTVTEAVNLFDVGEPDKNVVTVYDYDEIGRRVATTTYAGAPWAQTRLTLYDALSRPVRQIANYVAQGNSAPGDWEWNATNAQWEDGAANAISHGSENNQNIISGTAYNARGLTRLRRDVLGNVTLYGYDEADRLVKTIQNASQPDYNNDYSGTGADPNLSSYMAGSDADQDIIIEQVYDAVGNLVQSISATGSVSFAVYDALNRPIKTVQNAKDAATIALDPGDVGYVAANDPRSDDYVISLEPDRDHISIIEYDALRRMVRTRRLLENRDTLEAWDVTLYGYDALGRQVRVIQHASQPEYDLVSDPDLSAYTPDTGTDVDILTDTEYDTGGRVLNTIDVNGTVTHSVYDGLGRQVKTVANYVPLGVADTEPETWRWLTLADTTNPAISEAGWYAAEWDSINSEWDILAEVEHGALKDQNIVSETVYDDDGRVEASRNVAGLVSRSGYDARGRQVIGIQNFVDDNYDPVTGWVYESGVWKDASSGTAINRGSGYDQNVIAGTEYDSQRRVLQTRDVRGNVTRFVYDSTGRGIMTIANYMPQGSSDPADWEWDAGQTRWEDGTGNAIAHGTQHDQNLISTTTYDVAGRTVSSRDAAGNMSRIIYDGAGRNILNVSNYTGGSDPADWAWDEADLRWEDGGNAIAHGTQRDQNLISQTVYNQAGQMVSSRDMRGTQTTFAYDTAGRRVSVTQAASTGLDTLSYTCFDKAGRVLRTIQNWRDDEVNLPDTYVEGIWAFDPTEHGNRNDENLISTFAYDRASRRVGTADPLGNTLQTSYFKDGQIDALIDPLEVVTAYRYDALRRRRIVVQNYTDSSDPVDWVWDDGDEQWEDGASNPISHGSNQDENIIAQVRYDLRGQMVGLRNPRGYETTYEYDALGRRTKLTNPLTHEWLTAFEDVGNASRTTMSYPNGYDVVRDFDLLGRVSQINYGSPSTTPDVQWAYDLAGNHVKMSEFAGAGFTNRIRETSYNYDAARRLSAVGFDQDGSGTVDETVSYAYDVGGLRTTLTIPGSLSISYTYDRKGRLIRAEDWDGQFHSFHYDNVDRYAATERPNRVTSQYRYDTASRLKRLAHRRENRLLAQFDYEVDARGNRTRAKEYLMKSGTTTETANYAPDYETTNWQDQYTLEFAGYEATFTYGTSPDSSRFDVYVNGTLWESFDGYAASSGEETATVSLTEAGLNTIQFRNSHDKAATSSGYRMHIKTIATIANAHTLHEIEYEYDQLTRLLNANYVNGGRSYANLYDVAGNRRQEQVTIGLTTTLTQWEYDAANRIQSQQIGSNPIINFSFDNNGNLLDDGVLTYTYNRGNRLISVHNGSYNTHYAYDGAYNRYSKTIGTDVTRYLLDLQPGLKVVLSETLDANTTYYLHSPTGVHAAIESNDWHYYGQDGLGSVRTQWEMDGDVEGIRDFAPYGMTFSEDGSFISDFGFAGEQVSADGLSYNRDRYYNLPLGTFTGLDAFEGQIDEPLSLNGYSYVHGNSINFTDPTGRVPEALALACVATPGCAEVAFFVGIAVAVVMFIALLAKLIQELNPGQFVVDRLEELGNTIVKVGNFCASALDSLAQSLTKNSPSLCTFGGGMPVCYNNPAYNNPGLLNTLNSQAQNINPSQANSYNPANEDLKAKRREIEKADEAQKRKDAKNPFDIAFGLSNYSGVFPDNHFGDLTAFTLSFKDRRTYSFLEAI